MARAPKRKVKLTYITNESARKATLKKRMNGLVKKLEQVTMLCDLKCCAIIYSNPRDNEPTLFPNDPNKVKSAVSDLLNSDNQNQTTKMLNQESLLMERVNKADETLKRLQKENRKKMLHQYAQELLYDQSKGFDFLTTSDLVEIQWMNRCYLGEIDERIQDFKKDFAQVHNLVPPVLNLELEQPNMVSPSNVLMNQEKNVKSVHGIEQVQFHQWLAGMMRNFLPDEASSSNNINI